LAYLYDYDNYYSILDSHSVELTPIPSMNKKRSFGISFTYNSIVYVFGGQENDFKFHFDVEAFNPA